MRGFQRSITHSFTIVAILIIATALSAGYFAFYIDAKKAGKLPVTESINSFEDCAKHYPVMESYPEQCNTPNGKHFTRELTAEEKQRQMFQQTTLANDKAASWETYSNPTINLNFRYPADWRVEEEYDKTQINIFYPGNVSQFFPDIALSYAPGEAIDQDYSMMSEPEEQVINGKKAVLRKDKETGLPRAGGHGFIQSADLYGTKGILYVSASREDPYFSKFLQTVILK